MAKTLQEKLDEKAEKEYYKTHPICECAYFRNFYAQSKEQLPKLNEFLSDFGVDILRPDESGSFEMEDTIEYLFIDYTVCGKILEDSEYEIDIYDNVFISMVVCDGSISPNEQTGEHFTFSIRVCQLPWVLDEPLNPTVKERFFDKVHEFFKKNKN